MNPDPDPWELGPPSVEDLQGKEIGTPGMEKQLTRAQQCQLTRLIEKFCDIFQEECRLSQGAVHHIYIPPGKVVQEYWQHLPQWLQDKIRKEITCQLKGISKESHSQWRRNSQWRSPVVLYPTVLLLYPNWTSP